MLAPSIHESFNQYCLSVCHPGPALGQHWVSVPRLQRSSSKHPMLFKIWSTVFDAGPALKQHWVNGPCLPGCCGSICCCSWQPQQLLLDGRSAGRGNHKGRCRDALQVMHLAPAELADITGSLRPPRAYSQQVSGKRVTLFSPRRHEHLPKRCLTLFPADHDFCRF